MLSIKLRSYYFPDGSPICPVAPPIRNIGLKPIVDKRIKFIIGKKFPKWRLSDVGSKPIFKKNIPEYTDKF